MRVINGGVVAIAGSMTTVSPVLASRLLPASAELVMASDPATAAAAALAISLRPETENTPTTVEYS